MTARPAPLQPEPAAALLWANLACMLSMLVWAAGLPAADLLIGKVPALPLTAARMALAVAVLLPFWLMIEGRAALARADWWLGIRIGGFAFGLGSYLIVLAQARTDAVTVAVISATMPVVGIALECFGDGRRLRAALVAGVILSLLGGLVAYGGRLTEAGFGLGALLALGSVTCFTWGSRASVTRFPALTPLGRTSVTMTGAALATTLAALLDAALGGAAPDWSVLGLREFGALALYGIGAVAISQVLWVFSVGHLGIGIAALHSNAAPFYVMLLVFALGGPWSWAQVAGAVLVALGVLIAQGLLPLPRPGRRA